MQIYSLTVWKSELQNQCHWAEVKVSAVLLLLEALVFCVFQLPEDARTLWLVASS